MAALTPLILLLASLQSAQDFDQKVTFTGKAMSIQSAISLLAKQTGVPLEPSGSLPEWHIYLHCTDQPLKDVMEKLGDTVYAEWVADQGKYFLRTSSKKLNVARQAQITINAGKLKKEIDKRLKDAASAPPMTRERAEEIAKKMREFQTDDEGRDWKEYSKLQALDPSKSFTWQLLSRCNLREIAAIKPGERIVFALNPTPLQRQLDRTFVANRLPAFHRDFVEWGLANNQDGEVSPDQDAEQAKSMQEYRLQEEQKLRNFQCAEVLLTVTLERENPSYRISLGLFDARGDRAGSGFDQEYFSLANDGQEDQADMMKQAAPKDGEKKLELSQEEKDFGKMLMGAFDFDGRGEPRPPIK
ncbi:MAG: hypothetical protein K8R88_03325, partial [Armatimonadetes bacterium]|nr:hypothetical protein [Armatimonadota bacterium]